MGKLILPKNYQKRIKTKKPTIAFCVPGDTFSRLFVLSFIDTLLNCFKYNLEFFYRIFYTPNIYTVRNKLILGNDLIYAHEYNQKRQPFDNLIDYDYIMWIDSDMVFDPWQFKQLLDHDKAIVSGLTRHPDDTFNCGPDFDDEYLKEHGTFERYETKFFADKKDLVQVGWIGFAFMLIRKGVFEDLSFPWFKPEWYQLKDGGRIYLSEDQAFCREAKEKGYKIYVDPTIEVGHEKKRVIGGKFR